MTSKNSFITEFLKKNIFIISAILIAVIFSNWQFWQLLSKPDICCHEAPTLSQNFFFYPYISIWLSKIIESGFGSIYAIFIKQILIPSIIFYLIAIIFNRYLSKLWSLTIAFISVISFADYPFRNFLIDLIKLPVSDWKGSSTLPEITGFPLPSLSVIFFLSTFYYSTKPIELSRKRITIFTIIWSLQIYINAIDALFGICLWFSYFFIKIIRRRKIYGYKKIFNLLLLQIFILAIISAPAIVMADFSIKNISNLEHFNISIYYILYIILPIALTALLYKVHKVDPYEILYKFWSVYILMFIEFILVSSAFFFNKGVNLEILTSRIPLFFLHFYYYLPVIFYASKEYYPFYIGRDGNNLTNIIRKIIYIIFNKLSCIYLPIIIILNILFAIISSKYFNLIN